MSEARVRLTEFLAPRFWPTWMGLGLMRALCLLPFRFQLLLGRSLGWASYRLASRRRKIAEKNFSLCFPELNDSERNALVKKHFGNLGQAVFETAFTWWASDKRLSDLDNVEGLEYISNAFAQGKGVILLSAHFTTLELGCRLLLLHVPFHAMYRDHENPLFGEIMRANRAQLANIVIRRDDVRQLIKSIKSNHAVWYAPDQAFRGKNSARVRFFGQMAPTNLATSRLAKMTGAPVIPFFSERNDATGKYLLRVLPPLENFPSDDPLLDAERINQTIEAQVRRAPEQYLWTHRRFKAVNPGDPDPYDGL